MCKFTQSEFDIMETNTLYLVPALRPENTIESFKKPSR